MCHDGESSQRRCAVTRRASGVHLHCCAGPRRPAYAAGVTQPEVTPGEAATAAEVAEVPTTADALARLVAEAASKSKILWIDVPGDRTWPAWHVWVEGTAYVVSGPGEQPLPELPDEVVVTFRSKDSGGRLLRLRARTERLGPEDQRWEPATAALRAGRLNAPGPDVVQRWADECAVTALVPGELLQLPGRYDDRSGAAPPLPTPATTVTWQPWHARGRPRRRRRLLRRDARRGSSTTETGD